MHISIEWHDKNFNINMSSSEGHDPFLSIKGCRLVESGDKSFVGFPARKNEQTGKWWNHVWGSDAFQDTIIKLAKKAKPKAPSAGRKDGGVPAMDDDIPF